MPQGDSQAFFTGDDADDEGAPLPFDPEEKEQPDRPEVPPDFPPESFWLSKDAEFDWFDRNAFFERKESTKASSNSTNLNPNLHPQSISNSQRFSSNLKSKASMIGLPKTQNTAYVDAKNRRNCKSAGNIRLFPKRSGSGGKSVSSMIEPSSPKVSCMGRVRSKKDRNRKKNHHNHNSSEAAEVATAKDKSKEKSVEKQRKGFFSSFRTIFRSGGRRQPVVEPTASPPEQNLRAPPSSATNPPPSASLPSKIDDTEPPALGGLHRFASGRRSDSWSVSEAGIEVA